MRLKEKRKMNLDDYLRLFRKQLFYQRIKEEPQLFNFFHQLSSRDGIEFVEIYSTSIYPQIIQISDKRFILWDNHFWDLYERFLIGIDISSTSEVNSNVIFDYINAITMLFLTNRFDGVPCLSYLFAKHYAGTGFVVPPYNKFEADSNREKLVNAGYHKILVSSKLYIFFHEYIHHMFDKDPELFSVDCEDIVRLCSKFIDFWPDNDGAKDAAIEIVKRKDQRLMEEVCCDIRAVTESINLLFTSQEGTDKKQVIQEFIKAIRYLLTFNGSLAQIEGTWRINRRGIDEYGSEFLLHTDEHESQLKVVLTESDARINLIINLSFYILGPIDTAGYDFVNTEGFEKYIAPPLELAMSSKFMKNIIEDYLNLKDRYTVLDFRTSKNMLIGWY